MLSVFGLIWQPCSLEKGGVRGEGTYSVSFSGDQPC